jgi:hypothetical protein
LLEVKENNSSLLEKNQKLSQSQISDKQPKTFQTSCQPVPIQQEDRQRGKVKRTSYFKLFHLYGGTIVYI